MELLELFVLSVLPVFLIGYFIYRRDKEKEPIKLLVKLFVGGMISCVPTIILELAVAGFFPDRADMSPIQLILSIFIGIALIEELCKWVVVYKLSYNNQFFDQFFDMIVYSVFVALGFACLENLLFVYSSGVVTALLRAISAVPGHACDGIFMGYYLGLAKLSLINNRKDLSKKYFILSLVVPIVIHGIYDYCLVVGNVLFVLIFLIFLIAVYVHCFKKIKVVSSVMCKMKNEDNYCPNCGHIVNGNYCPNCGGKNY